MQSTSAGETAVTFSIIVPVYNVVPYIERCVQSAIDQIGRDDEIILIDDGSTDHSGLYCDWFKRTYGDCVRVTHQRNMGLSEARNTGIREAEKDYIVFLDSDDWLTRGALAQTRHILQKRQVDVLIGKYRAYQQPPKKDIFDDPTDFEQILGGDPTDTQAVVRGIFEKNLMFTAWRNVVRREFIKRNGLMFEPGILHEDEEWCPRLYTTAQSFAWNSKPFYGYRLRDGSIVYTRNYRRTLGLMAGVQTLSELSKRRPDLRAGLTRKYSELAGRALQTLPQYGDEDRTRIFEALPKYPAMSRYLLLLKNRANHVMEADAGINPGADADSQDAANSFDKMVEESDDGELLAKWALVAYYTMARGVRDAVKARSKASAGPAVEMTDATVTPVGGRRSLRESMERMMNQTGAPRLSNVYGPPPPDSVRVMPREEQPTTG